METSFTSYKLSYVVQKYVLWTTKNVFKCFDSIQRLTNHVPLDNISSEMCSRQTETLISGNKGEYDVVSRETKLTLFTM